MSDNIKPKDYTNGEVTVRWDQSKCFHAAECVRGLPLVFDPKRRPWIKLDEASSKEIVATVSKCPSGALSMATERADEAGTTVTVIPTGPYRIKGNFVVEDMAGNKIETGAAAALCACGQSRNKPFCDGSHKNLPGYIHPKS